MLYILRGKRKVAEYTVRVSSAGILGAQVPTPCVCCVTLDKSAALGCHRAWKGTSEGPAKPIQAARVRLHPSSPPALQGWVSSPSWEPEANSSPEVRGWP